MNDLSEQVRELRDQLAEQQELIGHLRSLHRDASESFIGLRDQVRDIQNKLRTVENELCCIQHIDRGVSQ